MVDILFSHGSVYAETWNMKDNRWESHSRETIRIVETGDTLLYRLLPDGIMGTRLEDCPGLADELSKLGEKKSASKPSKRKRVEESDLEQASDSPTPCTPIRKKYRKADKHHTHTSTPTITSSRRQRHTIVIRSPTQSPASSRTRRVNSTSCHLLPKTKKSPYPLVNKHMSIANKGERLFPTSFYTVDVIDGFEDMDRKSSQRRPRMLNKDAFESTFRVTYVRPTYQKARRLYEDNRELASKFSGYGRTKRGAWANFRNAAEAGGVDDESESDFNEVDNSHNEVIQLDVLPEEFLHNDEEDIDWSQHCNYCDEELPTCPSQILLDLQTHLDSRSVHDGANGHDASANPNHRYIRPIVETIEYCQRHRFELVGYPNAANNSTWFSAVPVNFDILPARLKALEPQLNQVYMNPFENIFYESLAVHGTNTAGEYVTMSTSSAG